MTSPRTLALTRVSDLEELAAGDRGVLPGQSLPPCPGVMLPTGRTGRMHRPEPGPETATTAL
jgi:hypothetical protein